MEKKSSVSSSYCSSSATGGAGGGGGGDSLHGLNFGKKIYFEGVGSISRPRIDDQPPKSPAKKGRCAAAHGGQPPRCQVEGCNVDLSNVKAYYSRHKVCGMHSKSPKVIVAGIEQRFCQQCSRFHQLSEFDQGKRSCRRRLAGHNERRRKPPLVPMLSPRFGLFATPTLDNQSRQGGFLMNFNSYSNHHQGNYSMMKYEAPWQSNNSSSLNPTVPNLGIVSSSSSSSEECYSTRVSDSSGALSLLSNHQSWAGCSKTLASSSIGQKNFLENNVMNNTGQFGSALWDFKGNEMCPDLGLAHMSHHGTGNNDRMSSSNSSQYNGGIGLSQQQASDGQFHELGLSRGNDPSSSSSSQHINWWF